MDEIDILSWLMAAETTHLRDVCPESERDACKAAFAEIRRRVEAGAAPDLSALIESFALKGDDFLEISKEECGYSIQLWRETSPNEVKEEHAPTLAACLAQLLAATGRGEGT